MSHCLIEVPKEPPLEGCWIFIVAKNWIYEDVLYTPDHSYSPAYKHSLLVNGKDPDIITWGRCHSFKVIHQFDSYEEARANLPRAEKGLPIITSASEIGRGYRQRIEKSRKLPGELSTTEQDTEQEENSSTQTKKSTLKKRSTPVKRKSSSETTKLPLPPSTLRSKNRPNSSQQIALSTVKTPSVTTASLAGPSGLSEKKKETRCKAVNNARSCSTQVMSFQKNIAIQDKLDDDDIHSDSSEEGFPVNIHGDTNDMESIPPYWNDSQMMTPLYTPRPTPSPGPFEPSYSSQQYSAKKSVDKGGGLVAKVVLTTLAQMNEKLSVLEKSMAKPVAEVSEDEDDDLNFLPVKTITDFEKFEKNLKQNKEVYRKLISMIKRLGKRNTKNSQGDYVRRAWGCVVANSVAKDLNWLGRPDKRVNNGLGKRGIKESVITKAIQRGITSNKDFKEMEISTFECETKTFLKNSKATYDRKANAPERDEEDNNTTDD